MSTNHKALNDQLLGRLREQPNTFVRLRDMLPGTSQKAAADTVARLRKAGHEIRSEKLKADTSPDGKSGTFYALWETS